jgi:hypothetical protein
MLFGAPKVWYAIPGNQVDLFETVLRGEYSLSRLSLIYRAVSGRVQKVLSMVPPQTRHHRPSNLDKTRHQRHSGRPISR